MKKGYLSEKGDDPWADHIRERLRRRVGLELGITLPSNAVSRILRCLDKSATKEGIAEIHVKAIQETLDATWGFEIEALLRELHGAWRYDGRKEVLSRDMAFASRFYIVAFTMDQMLEKCGFPVVRNRQERLDDAAWYAVPEMDRRLS